MRAFFVAALGTVIATAAALPFPAAQEPSPPAATVAPSPPPTPNAAPTPIPLRLDIDRHVAEVLARRGTADLPRFEERVEVVERTQSALDDLLRGLDLECGPSSAGPPPVSELNRYRGARIPPHADFLALAKLLAKGLDRLKHRKPRWFLYRIRHPDAVLFVLREGEAAKAVRYATPGTTWEEVARFHDRERAIDALRRLERGFSTPERRTKGDRQPPWVATTCRPPGFH